MRSSLQLRCWGAVGLLLALIACGSPAPIPPAPDEPDFSGNWRAVSGAEVFGTAFPATYLQLPEAVGGHGRLLGAHASTGILSCLGLSYAAVNDGAMVYSLEGGFGMVLAASELLLVEQPDDDTLVLTTPTAHSQTFERVATIPSSAFCELGETAVSVADLGLSYYSSADLESDGVSLWAVDGDDELLYEIDAATGVVGAGIDVGGFSQFSYPLAVQDGDFWLHCHCGGNQSVERRSVAGILIDEVDTDLDLGQRMGIDTGALDGDGLLWLHGYISGEGFRLYGVDTSVDPPVLLHDLPFDVMLSGMTFADGALWALTADSGQSVIRIDPSSGLVTRTIKLPAPEGTYHRYVGLAAHGEGFYTLVGDWDTVVGLVAIDP